MVALVPTVPLPPLSVQDLPEPQLDAETRAAFDLAYENIAAFHRAQQVGRAAHLLLVDTARVGWQAAAEQGGGLSRYQLGSNSNLFCHNLCLCRPASAHSPPIPGHLSHTPRQLLCVAPQAAPVEVETMPGVRCWRVSRPIGAVGLYVPGGTAVLPSSALMLAVPAAIAGCSTIVLVSRRSGRGGWRWQRGSQHHGGSNQGLGPLQPWQRAVQLVSSCSAPRPRATWPGCRPRRRGPTAPSPPRCSTARARRV